MFAVIAVAISH